jgi:hypothetical protein
MRVETRRAEKRSIGYSAGGVRLEAFTGEKRFGKPGMVFFRFGNEDPVQAATYLQFLRAWDEQGRKEPPSTSTGASRFVGHDTTVNADYSHIHPGLKYLGAGYRAGKLSIMSNSPDMPRLRMTPERAAILRHAIQHAEKDMGIKQGVWEKARAALSRANSRPPARPK